MPEQPESIMRDHLLWIDLETTGSSVQHDCIVEVGAILTTADLVPLGERAIMVTPEPEGLGRMMQNPVVREMHEANGLLAELLDPAAPVRRPHDAAKDLLAWMTALGAQQGRTVLAGSGVAHFDRPFIARWMPQVDRFLRYWCIDIGVVRRAHEMFTGSPSPSSANANKTHRALDDIRLHLEEARAFKALWTESGL